MSDSKLPERADFEDGNESDETSIDLRSDRSRSRTSSNLDTLTLRFDEISNESHTILHTLKSKMTAISKVCQEFNETTDTFNAISKECGSLLSDLNSVKSEMVDKGIINIQKPNSDTQLTNNGNKPNIKYSKVYLKSLSKTELIDIIMHQNSHNCLPSHNAILRTKSSNTVHPHEKVVTNIKATERMATDYDKIEKQRHVIHALHNKNNTENELKNRNAHHKETEKMFVNPHEKVITNIKATERMATDYRKIEKQRATIKALKEKNKMERMKSDNVLRLRNAHRTDQLFTDPHEKVPKSKEIKRQKKHSKKYKGHAYVYRDKVKEKEKERDKGKDSAFDIEATIFEVRNEREIDEFQNKGKLCDAISAENDMMHRDIEEFDKRESVLLLRSDSQLVEMSENSAYLDAICDCGTDSEILLESELLKMNLKMLKKRCRDYMISTQGGKLEMIAKILAQEQNLKQKLMDDELKLQDEFMREMAALSGTDNY